MFMIKRIANKANVSVRHLYYILAGGNNASPVLAKKLQRLTGISREVWVFGTKRKRQEEWAKFKKSQRKIGGKG